ncbi:cytochrome c biogenesis protein CcdA [Thermococcus sp. GR6]|uniref:cytochrome c biogenesis protein CcdA n=1 Tax=Thermococcus sp. GR6 TaxID=1638256 RepID=UPI0014311B11|nr:cytochrome c biogenesis protein CcdA [Thermococcus sp. GR6]NJE41930.1 cytochrome c biogenesis protein [Thermococcus sp. GR6]
MRKLLPIIFIFMLSIGFAKAGEVKYGELTFHDVSTVEELDSLIKAHEGEYFFIFYHSESCPACNYMKTSVFPTEKSKETLSGLNLVSIDVYKARSLTTLRYRVYDDVVVIQPDNTGYYRPKTPGEEISVGVPGTPTMVIFKVENGTKILKGVAIGALNPNGLEFFVKTAVGNDEKPQGGEQTQTTETATHHAQEDNTNLTLAVLLPIFSAGILSVFSPCVLPLIVGTFSLTFARRSVELIIAGMVLSFAILGALAGSFGSYAAQIRGALYLIGGLGFIVIGLGFLSESVSAKLEGFLSFSASDKVASKRGKLYDFALGSALGATWLGCIAPYVGFAVITAALSGDTLKGIIVMGTYGLGMGLTVYLITTSKDLGDWINRKFLSGRISLGKSGKAKWERALGVILVLLGLLMLTELTPLKLWSALFEGLSKL